MPKDFSELNIILGSGYSKQDIEEAKGNLLGFFETLQSIKERLNKDQINDR